MINEHFLKLCELRAHWWMTSAVTGHCKQRMLSHGDGTLFTDEEKTADALETAQEVSELYGLSKSVIYGVWLNYSYKDKNYIPLPISQKGSTSTRAKFTDADIDFIRTSDLSVGELADMFNVKSTTISKIRLNLRYIDPDYTVRSSRKNITADEIQYIRQLAETKSITEVSQIVDRPYMYVYKIVTRRMYAYVI